MASVETLGALERRLNASIPQQQIRSEIEARLKRLGKTAKASGFRQGKVPLKIVEQQHGAQVHQEVLGNALQSSFAEAMLANSLKVAGYPKYEITTTDPAAAQIEYSATFEVYPEVILGDIALESVECATYTLSEDDVDNAIAKLLKQHLIFEPCDRAAQKGDQVRIDFNSKLDGKVFEGGEVKDFKMVLGGRRMFLEFEDAITGMKAGEIKSFDKTFPKDYHGKNVAGKQVTFTIKLHVVEASHPPQLDDEFAKSLGIKDGNVENLKIEIRTNLAREAERRLKLRNKDNAMTVLLKIGQLDVPKVLLEAEMKMLSQQALREMKERGVNMPGMSVPPERFTEQAQKRVKLGLILSALIEQHNWQAKPEQVKALVQEYAHGYEHPEEVVAWHYSDPSRLRDVENLVLEDNAVAWVMGAAKVTGKALAFNEFMENK